MVSGQLEMGGPLFVGTPGGQHFTVVSFGHCMFGKVLDEDSLHATWALHQPPRYNSRIRSHLGINTQLAFELWDIRAFKLLVKLGNCDPNLKFPVSLPLPRDFRFTEAYFALADSTCCI